MSCELKVVTCGTQKSVTDTELHIPVANKIVYNANEIKIFIAKHSTSVLFIILFLDLFHENINLILTELSQQKNIIAILICDNLTSKSLSNQQNIFRISPQLITNEITFRAIRAYEFTSQKLLQDGPKNVGMVFEQKANDLKQWHITNNKVLCVFLIRLIM
jgi:hypothetical protein